VNHPLPKAATSLEDLDLFFKDNTANARLVDRAIKESPTQPLKVESSDKRSQIDLTNANWLIA
jgi:hypothetical protein